MSLFVKERLYIGEATVATIAGLILGPHCLGWFDPLSWGNAEHLTLEICRIVLCIQIVAVAVELPRKYMKKHWLSVALLLVPVMTAGWLVVGLFIWVLIPHFSFPAALLVSACVTATDPVLAAAVVGKGKFAERVPGHLRNLLTAESGCNDGMAFPFIFLSLYILIHPGNAREVVKDWFTLTILWECIFGAILGAVLGYILRKAVYFAEKKSLIDRESFLALFIFLAFNSAGIGSMLGVDDLLVSFAAGTAFGWNGDFAKKTEESHVSTVIDLLLNLSFFVYFGAIVPWAEFSSPELGLDVWRLIVLAIVIIFLRRIPAVLALKPFIPDIKSWREALFCGHFGPIGVGAIFAAILARQHVEEHASTEETDLSDVPLPGTEHYQLIATIWPMVSFIVIVSIVVHGSSVAVLALGKRLNRMAITMSFTVTNTQEQGSSWMSRLQKLENTSTSYSLHRIDSLEKSSDPLPQASTVETSGIKVRPAGGARRKKHRRRKGRSHGQHDAASTSERARPPTEFLQLGRTPSVAVSREEVSAKEAFTEDSSNSMDDFDRERKKNDEQVDENLRPANVYEEGDKVMIEDADGEIIDTAYQDSSNSPGDDLSVRTLTTGNMSLHSEASLRRHMSEYSVVSEKSLDSTSSERPHAGPNRRKTIVKSEGEGRGKRFYAHRVDNMLFIENIDGDIIRRYKLNKHPNAKPSAQASASRSRSGTLMGKALSMVGLKKPKEVDTASELINHPARSPEPLREELSDYGSDETDEDSVNDLTAETEVEKARRLAALGEISTGRRDASDEE